MAMAGLGLDSDDKKERTGNTLTGEQLLDFGLFFPPRALYVLFSCP